MQDLTFPLPRLARRPQKGRGRKRRRLHAPRSGRGFNERCSTFPCYTTVDVIATFLLRFIPDVLFEPYLGRLADGNAMKMLQSAPCIRHSVISG